MKVITGKDIAETAINSGLIGTPYSALDCQAFVEVILQRAGLKIPNYRGSNHMWRELVYDRSDVTDPLLVPAGALVFKLKYDGGEQKRGYHDEMGNAVHVGINLGDGLVLHSTTGGVQYGKTSQCNRWALIKDVVYSDTDYEEGEQDESNTAGPGPTATIDICVQIIDEIVILLKRLEDKLYDLE